MESIPNALPDQNLDVDATVIPVIREDWQIHKEMREVGTVRVGRSVREHEELIRDTLASETVDVQRVPLDQVVSSVPPVRTEGDVTIIPVVKEFAVVVKQLRVVEEIRVTRTRSQMAFQQPVLVRADEVTVQRIPAGSSAGEAVTGQELLTLVERREEAVVSKSARVIEEVSIGKEAIERVVTVKDVVRHTEVDVEHWVEENAPKSAVASGQ